MVLDEPSPTAKPRPSVWVLLGWTLASLYLLPLAVMAVVWTVLLIGNPELRRGLNWWTWWTIAQISLPAFCAVFSSTLLAYQRRLEIEPPSGWLLVMQRVSVRSVLATAAIGFAGYLIAERKYALLTLLAVGVASVLWNWLRARRVAS